jgi:hypothetical protein
MKGDQDIDSEYSGKFIYCQRVEGTTGLILSGINSLLSIVKKLASTIPKSLVSVKVVAEAAGEGEWRPSH